MDIVIDFNAITNKLFSIASSPDVFIKQLFFYLGWIPISLTFLWGAKELWLFSRQNKWAEKNAKFTTLAIDIPRGNAQSPRAVENLFSYLGGAHSSNSLIDTYWDGKFQLAFSLEIISVGGYTQFLIRTPISSRDLVESAVYAQYPDAEITEVEDYTTEYKNIRFPNDKYDLAGAEFVLVTDPALPIKTYPEFEHQFGEPETTFRDPMASLMDLCSSLKPGEQLWYQILVIPTEMAWPKFIEEKVSLILKEKPKAKPNIFNQGADQLLGLIGSGARMIAGGEEPEAKKEEKKDDSLKMMNLKPNQKKQVESIHLKSAKMPFKFKIRTVYLSEKEVMNKAKVFSGFVGFIKQFTDPGLNGLKPDMDRTGTSTAYFFRDKHLNDKKNRLFGNYIGRSVSGGRSPSYMNVEELATIWHFPIEGVVKAPLIGKTAGRKAEPPMSLPQSEVLLGENNVEPLFLGDLDEEDLGDRNVNSKNKSIEDTDIFSDPKEETSKNDLSEDEKGAPPSNLPFV